MSAIRVRDLHKSFDNVHAVAGLNLDVRPGQVYGYLGPNGAGKTTTINLLLGLMAPDSGYAEVLGMDVSRRAHDIRRQCGVLLEHDGLYERLSVESNLTFHARQYGVAKEEAARRAATLLADAGWADRASDPAGNLSRGMKRRLAVLRAFITEPKLVFLDEPTSGFDPKVAADLRRFLTGVSREHGTTVFLTTHNMQEAEAMCDQVGVLRDGHIVAGGTPGNLRDDGPRIRIAAAGIDAPAIAALKRRKDIADVEVADDGVVLHMHRDVPAAPIVASLVRRGVAIEEVHKMKASLEDDFIAIMEAQ